MTTHGRRGGSVTAHGSQPPGGEKNTPRHHTPRTLNTAATAHEGEGAATDHATAHTA
jgi:hypothetical protein